MRAIVRDQFGSPDVLSLGEVEPPTIEAGGSLVRVHAASVNPYDWHMLTGTPYLARMAAGLRRPKSRLLGSDFAGIVEAAGEDVGHVKPGDEVFGTTSGAFAEYAAARKSVVRKPANVSFEEAAAFGIAGVTALQALRDKGQIQAGQRVLINGASGGVGTFAVQIAKALGAEVTCVCSTRNVELVTSLGADHVIDYTQEDFTKNGRRYDLMLDIPGNRPWSECQRVLEEKATYVLVGGPKRNRWVASFGEAAKRRVVSLPGSRKVVAPFLAKSGPEPLTVLAELAEAGKLTPVVERTYSLSETPEALRYMGTGHARAKLVITV